MRKPLRTTVLYFCLVSIAVVLVWASVLGLQWYQAYKLEKLIISYVTMEKPPYTGVPKSQWLAESQAFEARRTETFGRLGKLNGWQQNIVLAGAVDAWRASNPRHSYGSRYLWHLLDEHSAHDLIDRIIETPLISYRVANPDAKTLVESVRWLHEEYWLPLSLLSLDGPLTDGRMIPNPEQGLRGELTALATSNGLVWEVSGQTILLGTQKELDDYRVHGDERRRRMASVGSSSGATNQAIQAKLDGLITLIYFATPLADARDFLRDYLGVNIVLLPDPAVRGQSRSQPGAGSPVTMFVQNVPVSVGFDCVVKQFDLGWDAFDEVSHSSTSPVVVIGTVKQLDDFGDRIKRRRERMDSLRRSANSQDQMIHDTLADPVTLEFVDASLADVMDFLMDYRGVTCLALNARHSESDPAVEQLADKPVTVSVQSVSLGMALDCLTGQNGFDWDVVDEFVCMGDFAAIQSFRNRLSVFDRKLADADESVRKLLQSPLVTVSPGCDTLKTGATGSLSGSVYAKPIEPGEYSAAAIVEFFRATMVVYGPPDDFGTPLVRFARNDVPFHRALDVVCELTGMDWDVQAGGTIRIVDGEE